jgi:hypothetical protein
MGRTVKAAAWLLAAALAASATARAAESGVEGVAALRSEFAPGVVVLAFDRPGPDQASVPVAVSAPTDANGAYRLALRPGSYHMLAVRASGTPWPFPGTAGDLFSYYLGSPVVVEAGKMTRVAFNMVRVGERPAPAAAEGSGIAGSILFEGKPLGRAYLQVYADAKANFRGMGLSATPVGEDGRFRIKLPPGRYYVLARKRQAGGMYGPPGRDDYVGYFPGNPVEVKAGAFARADVETTTRVDLLEKNLPAEGPTGGWFDGIVTDGAGRPQAGVYVLFYADEALSGAPAFVAGPTDPKGAFRVRAAVGTFHLLARSGLGGPIERGEWRGTALVTGTGKKIMITVSRYEGD